MVIRTILTCVIRFLRSIRAAFVSVSANTNDVESGGYKSFGAADVEMGRTSAIVEPNDSSLPAYHVLGRQPSRKLSTVRPVKSRIVDAVLRNVRDKRSSVLRDVVITRNSSLHLPCSVKVEVFPGPAPSSRASISTALRVLKTSGERVVKFVLTPTLLLDADLLPQAGHPARSDHSIEDIINLFPSPPARVSPESTPSPRESDFELNLMARDSEKRSSGIEGHRSSLFSFGSILSVTSGDTVATSPPTTPELAQMARMIIASTGSEPLSVESRWCRPSHVEPSVPSVESASAGSLQTNCSRKQTSLDQPPAFVPSCYTQATPVGVPHLTPWDDGYRRLMGSAIGFPLFQEGDMFSTNAHEDPTSSNMTSNGQQGRNPESTLTAIPQADSESMSPIKHILHAFQDREDRLRDILSQESCISGKISRFTFPQCLNASTPSSSAGRTQVTPSSVEDMPTSCSEGLAIPNAKVVPQHQTQGILQPHLYVHMARRPTWEPDIIPVGVKTIAIR